MNLKTKLRIIATPWQERAALCGRTARQGRWGNSTLLSMRRLRVLPRKSAFLNAITSLPYVASSGKVRDIWQAIALSPEVVQLLGCFKTAITQAEQKALVEGQLTAWAATLGMVRSQEERAAGKYRVQYDALGNAQHYTHLNATALADTVGHSVALMTDAGGARLREHYRQFDSRLELQAACSGGV